MARQRPSQGPDGVCGPCSEIFYKLDGGGDVEIWNLVFTQFNRVGAPPNNLRPLPSKNIDTGMGLERIASVLQKVTTNFHIDILRPLVETAADVCGTRYEPAGDQGRRLRRIADHVRACTFAIHENVQPDAKKQGYVIRRLLRRAVLDGRQLGLAEPFLHKIVPKVAELMKAPYPELGETVERVASVIKAEETSFFANVDGGLERIERIFAAMRSGSRQAVAGAEAAEMYTTYGFPPELFETLAAEHDFSFDWDGFKQEMERHAEISGGENRKELFKSGPLDALKKTAHATTFLGYESTVAEAKIVGLIAQNELCDRVDESRGAGEESAPVSVVLDRTPFYGESGGQVGDTGEIVGPGFRFEVIDTQKDGALFVHMGHVRSGTIELGATVDRARRRRAAPGDSPRSLGHAYPASRLAETCGQACPAARLEGRRRFPPVRLFQRRIAWRRARRKDRSRGQRQGARRR